MERLRSLSLFSLCLLATVCLLLPAARADALTLGYDRNYGTAYVNILRRASMEPMEMLGCTHKRLELFQDRRVDAIEVYDFEAERFQRGTSEPLYWYPHFTATVVFAVPENAPVPVTRWADLRQDVTVVLPDSSPAREIFFLLLAQRMGPDFDTAFHRLARMKEEGRLRFYPVHRGVRSIFAGGDVRDVYVVFDHEADRLMSWRRQATLRPQMSSPRVRCRPIFSSPCVQQTHATTRRSVSAPSSRRRSRMSGSSSSSSPSL